MREGLSHRIVAFIANLQPTYTHALIDDRHCARSLIDGTLILPLEEPEEDEDGRVEVHWQGDPARRTEVRGELMASIAVARYVEITAVPDSATTKASYAHLAQHFTHKTGGFLALEEPDQESAIAEMLRAATKRLGKKTVIEIIKKAIGL